MLPLSVACTVAAPVTALTPIIWSVSLILMDVSGVGGKVIIKRLPKWLRIFVFVVGSFVALIALALVLIRSPAVTRRVLPPVQAVLEKDFNLKTKISSLAIDPFARIALEDVEAEWSNPQMGQARIELKRLLVRFSFWELLKRNLQVTEVELVSPRVQAELNLPATQTSGPPTNPLPLIRKLISNPPAQFNLSSFAMRDLSIDATIKQGPLGFKLRGEKMNLESDVSLKAKVLELGVKFSMGEDGGEQTSEQKLLLQASNLAPALPFVDLEIQPNFDLANRLRLSFADDKNPRINLSQTSLAFAGQRFQLNAKLSKGGRAQVRSEEVGLSSELAEPLGLILADVFGLENANGEEFAKSVPQKIPGLLKQLSVALKGRVSFRGLGAEIKLPTAGIDAETRLNLSIPFSVSLSPQDYVLSSDNQTASVNLEQVVLKGKALQSVAQFIKLEHLKNFTMQTPFSVRLTSPSFQNMSKPLAGMRLSGVQLSPQLGWSDPQSEMLSAQVSAEQKDTPELKVLIDSRLTISQHLVKLLPALKAAVDSVGLLDITANLKTDVSSVWTDLQTIVDTGAQGMRRLTNDFKVSLVQTTTPPKGSPTALFFPGGLQVSGRLDALNPAHLKDVKLTTAVDWAGKPLLKNQLVVNNLPRKLTLAGDTEVWALLRLRSLSQHAAQLGMLGGTQISAKWRAALPHSADNILAAQLPPINKLNAEFNADALVNFVERPVMPLFDKNMLNIAGPLKAQVKAALARGGLNVKVAYNLPQAGVPAFANVDKLAGTLNAQTKIDLSDGVTLGVQAAIGTVSPAKSLGLPDDVLPYLKDINAQLNLQSDLKTRVEIRQGLVTTGGDKLKVALRGGTDIKATNSRFEGNLNIKPPKQFRYGIRAQDKVSLDGAIQVGWELTQKEQKSLRLRGQASLENFSAQHQLGGLRNASGRIPFQQDLELPNYKSLKWSYLIQDNPFKRVDTSKFVPLLSDDSMLVIEELNALEKKFGPLRGRFSLSQNMLTIDRLDADVFEGVLAGQGFVDIQPSRLLAGLQGRVTKLNTALLSSKPEKAPPAPLSARLAMVVDLSKALVEGRVDVTEIGKNQLLALTDVLDPSGADPLLNKARLALAVGYPTYVGLQMQQGFLDMDVGISGLVTQQIKISNLPLSPIINAKTQDLVKTLREVPIQ